MSVALERTLGGPGSGNFNHAGRPGQIGGSTSQRGRGPQDVDEGDGEAFIDATMQGKKLVADAVAKGNRWSAPRTKEEQKQDLLARANPSPLARPDFVIGLHNDRHGETLRYVGAYGQEFKGSRELPDYVERGDLGMCYQNASKLVLVDPSLRYVEGYAKTKTIQSPMTFMHAWAIDEQGRVVDPTWAHDGYDYFGIVYDRKAYLKHMYRQGFYGVTSGRADVAQKVIATGGKGLRAEREQ